MYFLDGTKKHRGAAIIVSATALCLIMMISAACQVNTQQTYQDGNLNSPFQFAAYNDGYIYYNPDGTKIIKQSEADGSTAVTIFDITAQIDENVVIESVTGLTAYKNEIYFLYNVPDIYKYSQRIGKINCDGSSLTLNLTQNNYLSPSRIAYIRFVGDKFFITGDGYYTPSYFFSAEFSKSAATYSPSSYLCCDDNYIYGYSAGNIIAEPIDADIGDESRNINFPSFENFMDPYNEAGVIGPEAITVSNDGILFITLYNVSLTEDIQNVIYTLDITSDNGPQTLFEHNDIITNLLWYDGVLYFSDTKSIYKYDIKKASAIYICDYTEYEYPILNIIKTGQISFTILGGRLYPNLNDFSVSYKLKEI